MGSGLRLTFISTCKKQQKTHFTTTCGKKLSCFKVITSRVKGRLDLFPNLCPVKEQLKTASIRGGREILDAREENDFKTYI